MSRLSKWAAWTAAGLGGLAAVVLLGGFAASEALLRLPPAHVAGRPVVGVVGDPGRGQALAQRYGCFDCHAANLQGRLFDDIPGVVVAYAPNLTLVAAGHSDADLERAIRHGVGADGRPLWIMPSATFSHLSDQETADLIALIRAAPAGGEVQPRFKLRPMARVGALLGLFKSEPAVIAAHANPELPDFGPATAQGRSLARACVECHGQSLGGVAGGPLVTPDLMIAAAYDSEDFRRLMHTGVAAGGREVGMMSQVARNRFAGLSDAEIAALQAYLKTRTDHKIAGR